MSLYSFTPSFDQWEVAVKKTWTFIQGHMDPEQELGDRPTASKALFHIYAGRNEVAFYMRDVCWLDLFFPFTLSFD